MLTPDTAIDVLVNKNLDLYENHFFFFVLDDNYTVTKI